MLASTLVLLLFSVPSFFISRFLSTSLSLSYFLLHLFHLIDWKILIASLLPFSVNSSPQHANPQPLQAIFRSEWFITSSSGIRKSAAYLLISTLVKLIFLHQLFPLLKVL